MKPTVLIYMTRNFIAFCILFLAIVGQVHAQSTLPLQEKCAEEAKAFVLRLPSVEAYDSHYSKKLDGCFLRAGFFLGHIKGDLNFGNGRTRTVNHPHTMQALYNVFDGKIIGNFQLIGFEIQQCWVEKKKCKTIDEFENLLKPYLEQ